MAKPTNIIGQGAVADRPAFDANREGALYFQMDATPGLYRQSDSAWELKFEATAWTTEALQDLVAAMMSDSSHLDFTYDDTAGTISAVIKPASVTAAELDTAYAPLASPALTGTPTTPTAAPGTSSGQIASTAFVAAAIAALIDGAPGALDTLNELAAALADDASFATGVTTALAGKQDLSTILSALAGLTLASGKLIKATGTSSFSTVTLSTLGETLLALADAAAGRAAIGAAGLSVVNTFAEVQSYDKAVRGKVTTLTDAATIALDASLGNQFYCGLTAARTLGIPTNPPATGYTQVILVRLKNTTGGSITPLLTTAGSNCWRYGTTVTALPAIAANKTLEFTAAWNDTDAKWDVTGYSADF